MNITINEAKSAEKVQQACDVMQEAAMWLIHKGCPLWQLKDIYSEAIRSGAGATLYLAEVNGHPAGTIITQDNDEQFWPEIIDGSSLFFHKLAVRRSYPGKGVSTALIYHAYQLGKSSGRTHLRMDCSSKHPQLRIFYEKNGFKFHDQKTAGPWTVDRLFKHIE